MTQHALASGTSAPPSTAVAAGVAASTATSSPTVAQQIDAAMTKLLGVSATFKDAATGQDRHVSTREETVAMMRHYMDRLALTPAVHGLSVIHVAGTKGKGSTCAMTERILRQAGYKTGLFTSPHLISPCERVRINGRPVDPHEFLRAFDAVWDGLTRTAEDVATAPYPPMAWFFRFLTLLALRVFVDQAVDVVILEVGIGGRLDATNVVDHPVVCGITTLDLDHTRLLGDSIDRIAFAKGGIIKHGAPAFTSTQPAPAMAVLHECADEVQTSLTVAPTLDELERAHGLQYPLGMQGQYQRVNAGLAVALATTWLAHRRGLMKEEVSTPASTPVAALLATPLEPVVRDGLKNAFWPARAHIMDDRADHGTRFYIDGAHTLRSLEVCADWFVDASKATATATPRRRALFFTIHHERDVVRVIAPLLRLHFDRVYFSPTAASRPSLAKVLTFSEALATAGLDSVLAQYSAEQLQALDTLPEGEPQWQTTLARLWTALKTHAVDGVDESRSHSEKLADPTARRHHLPGVVNVCRSVAECIADLRRVDVDDGVDTDDTDDTDTIDASEGKTAPEQWSVLVTGSLYLAGETLSFLDWHE